MARTRLLTFAVGLLVLSLARQFPVAGQAPERLNVLDAAQAITFRGWSPDSRWLAYFTHARNDISEQYGRERGDLHFYHLPTGERCVYHRARTDDIFQNGEVLYYNAWLPDGRYLLVDGAPRAFYPCTTRVSDLSGLFPEPIHAIAAAVDVESTLLFRGENGWWLYSLSNNRVRPIRGIDPYDAGASGIADVSPDGQRIALTFDGVASTYVIDVRSGSLARLIEDVSLLPPGSDDIILRSRPHWIGNTLLYVPYAAAAGGVIVDIESGALLLEFSGLPIDEAEGSIDFTAFHAALGSDEISAIYHSETTMTEPLPAVNDFAFSSDGQHMLYHDPGNGYTLRRVDAGPETAAGLDISGNVIGVEWSDSWVLVFTLRTLFIHDRRDGVLLARFEPEEGGYILSTDQSQGLPGMSPDGRHLALLESAPGAAGQTLALLAVQ